MITINEQSLAELRGSVMQAMSSKRFYHTVSVEKMVAELCELFCPDQELLMRAAALLHDLTKECSLQEQIELCHSFGIDVTPEEQLFPKLFHARTAPSKILSDFSCYAHPTVLDAIRWHTTGRAGMSLTEQLLYLADYIDESRTFPNCVLLRRFFFGAHPEKMEMEERLSLLRDTLILSFDMTIKDLVAEGAPVAEDTVQARNYLIAQKTAR